MQELKAHQLSFFHKILVIDIETVSIVSQYDMMRDTLKKQWANKANLLRKYNPELGTDDEIFAQKAGIYSEFAKIICISAGRFVIDDGEITIKIKSYHHEDEKQLLELFLKDVLVFEQKQEVIFCGHNIKEFDLPFICRRSLIHALELPKTLQLSGTKPWNNPHIDTLELWRFGDYKHYVSLDLLAAVFDIPSSKTDMDGSQVSDAYWKNNNLNGIVQYCSQDIATTAQIFMRMKGVRSSIHVSFVT